jgi:hypothetical protein
MSIDSFSLREYRQRPDDYSISAMTKIYQLLSAEMSEIGLAGADVSHIRAKVGQRGELRPELYEIQFSNKFADSEHFGVRKNHVIEALRKPDYVEHFDPNPDPSEEKPFKPISLYTVTHNKLSNRDRFTLLARTIRNGYIQKVVEAWRVYHTDVDLSEKKLPIDIFKAFIDKYGVFLKAGEQISKLFIYQHVQFDFEDDPRISLLNLIGPAFPQEHGAVTGALDIKKSRLHNKIIIGMAYAIDVNMYAADLRKHGVPVDDLSYFNRRNFQLIDFQSNN